MTTPRRDIVAGPPELIGLPLAELEAAILGIGERKYRAQQIFDALYIEQVPHISAASTLPAELRDVLQEKFCTRSVELSKLQESADGTKKFLFTLRDGHAVESVLIHSELRQQDEFPRRRTLCISTQVGCNLGCVFCATGTLKMARNLSSGEIIDQFLVAQQHSEWPITNVVFMGMGEPLDNYDAVMRSTLILNDQRTKMVAPRRTTLSTAGVVPGIERMADEGRIIKLAISLHATTQGVREKLMPIARKWPLTRLMDAVEYYYRTTRKTVTYEYIIFENINDSIEDVRRLARIARRVPSKVNVIPFHEIDFTMPKGFAAELKPTPPDVFEWFVARLREEGVGVMVRSSSGVDIDAACGQLALSKAE